MLTRALAFALAVLPVVVHAETKLLPGSSAITGKVTLSDDCKDSEAMLWISTGSTLIYQASVVKDSSFEFHVMPGPMEVTVTSQAGCYGEAKFLVKKNEIKPIALNLAPVKTANRAPASAMSPDCISCRGGMPVMSFPPTMTPVGAPWWVPYGTLNYSNFYYPGPWMNGGIDGGSFPGANVGWWNGAAFGGKPNIYISAPAGTKLKLGVEMKMGSNILAAVPQLGPQGWEMEVVASRKLKVGQSEQPFLFYDFRLNPKVFQEAEGFCTTPEKLLPELARHLEVAGFESSEVKDFTDYWSYKMPRASSYCVYPQDERQLGRIAALKVAPVPQSITRVGFMIVPQDQGFEPLLFKSKPTRAWVPHELRGNVISPIESGRQLASDSVRVREWGVIFLRGKN